MHIAFVGPRGEFDRLKQRLVDLPALRARPRVVFNLLQIRLAVATRSPAHSTQFRGSHRKIT
eukprot:3637254-Prymnesium_polylepis.1